MINHPKVLECSVPNFNFYKSPKVAFGNKGQIQYRFSVLLRLCITATDYMYHFCSIYCTCPNKLTPMSFSKNLHNPTLLVWHLSTWIRNILSFLHEHLIMLTSIFHLIFFSFKVYANWVEILSSILEATLKNLSTTHSE